MVSKRTWQDFRNTGLLLFINTILHAFGWAIVMEADQESGAITSCYPARVKYRGFGEKETGESYKRIGDYLKVNADILANEVNDH